MQTGGPAYLKERLLEACELLELPMLLEPPPGLPPPVPLAMAPGANAIIAESAAVNVALRLFMVLSLSGCAARQWLRR